MAPRAWSHLTFLVRELAALDRRVRKRGLDGEGVIGTYGSIGFRQMLLLAWELVQAGLLEWRRENPCGRDRVHAVDFGAGINRPLLVWQALGLIDRGVGVELDSQKVSNGRVYCARMLHAAVHELGLPVSQRAPELVCKDVVKLSSEDFSSLRPSLGYSFSQGMGREAHGAMGRLMVEVESMQRLVLLVHTADAPRLLGALRAGAAEAQAVRRRGIRERAHELVAERGRAVAGWPLCTQDEAPEPGTQERGPGEYWADAGLRVAATISGISAQGHHGTYTAFVLAKTTRPLPPESPTV
ncbi:hypothetical protein HYH03_015339 [Edaphochlamys debaryana]|uniref:DOT1 domain-containing protein n=1 Tax=Edaphochlamys debaryana TaxID=47281 RepID=A0A835XLV6_9CHLO|nr:hypothetical protein HYH03_015339 [Edaphochlamys debaryana]|eukprot:KAG2485894.1 hypothetical protein HYH03_015339 [Edaphochlamys debaryana]